MANIKELIQSIESGDSSFDEKLAAINKMEETLVAMKEHEQEAIDDNVELIIEALRTIEAKVEAKLRIIPEKGEQGIQGPKGEQGDRGLDGAQGKDGKSGVDGKDGLDGKDGVSVQDAKIDFDGSLVITLSDGREINVGEVVPVDVAQTIHKIQSGSGGDSQTTLNAIAALQATIATYGTMATQNANAVAITGGTINNTTIGATTPNTGVFTTLTATGQTSLGGAAGAEAFRAITTASGVNRLEGSGGVTGSSNFPRLISEGSDASVWLNLSSKGSTGLRLWTNASTASAGQEQMRVSHTASAVNYVQVTGAATGGLPTISAQGSDAAVGLFVQSKGTSPIILQNGSAQRAVRIDGTGAGTNYFNIVSSATTQAPIFSIASASADTNVSAVFQSKGTGAIDLAAGSSGVNISNGGTVTAITRTAGGSGYATAPSVVISAPTTAGGVQATATCTITAGVVDSAFTITNAGSGYVEQPTVTFSGGGGSGAAAFAQVGSSTTIKSLGGDLFFNTASSGQAGFAVRNNNGTNANYLTTLPTASGGAVYTGIVGTDTNAGANWFTKGNGTHYFATNSGAQTQMTVAHTASAVNYVQVTGAATTVFPNISAQGSDTNIGLTLASKGTQAVRFNTNGVDQQFRVNHTANAVNFIQATGAATGADPVLSAQGSDTNIDLVLQPKGTGALQAQQTDSTATGGNARGANAVDWQTARNNASYVASGAYSVVGGGYANTASNSYSGVFSGLGNTSSGIVAVTAGGQANISAGSYSAIVGGISNGSYGVNSFIGGGKSNSCNGYYNVISGGFTNSGTSNSAVTTQSGTMNATTAVTLSGSNANIKVGQYITGTSIADDTYVAAVSGTSLTLSKVASGSSTSTLSFYTPHGVVVGGGNNQATGSYSFIGGGGDAGTAANRNVASGDWSTVGGGGKNIASGTYSSVVGGNNNQVSGYGGIIGGGANNVVNNQYGVVFGGNNNTATGQFSTITGGIYGTTRGIIGMVSQSASFSPIAQVLGITQSSLLVLARQTTDATATVLTSDANAASTTNQVILPNNSAYYFKGTVIANVTGGGNTKGWTIEGAIKRGANAASTALVGTPTVVSAYADAGAATWAITATADTTNGGLAITFTGQAGTTIRVVCKIETTEVTF